MTLWLILGCFLGPAGLGAQEPLRQEEPAAQTPYVERSQRQFTFYPGGKVEVTAAAAGSLKIIGWQRASVLAEIEKIIYRTAPEQAKVLSGQFPVSVRWTQTSATIRTYAPPESLAALEVNVTLYVPRDKTDIKAKLVKGDFAIGSISGWVEVNLDEGNIEASSMGGYFSGITRRGDLSVQMSGSRWNGHSFTAVTQRGAVNLKLPVEYSAALQLETRNGNIIVDYPEQQVEGESVPLHVVVKKNARSLTATVGSGGAPVRLLSTVGNVSLSAINRPLSK